MCEPGPTSSRTNELTDGSESAAPAMNSPPPAEPTPPQPQGMDAFPSLDSPAPTSEVRVTGFGGTGEDEDREKFESAFPDLSSEVPQQAVRIPAAGVPHKGDLYVRMADLW